jgi:hypothetical protein
MSEIEGEEKGKSMNKGGDAKRKKVRKQEASLLSLALLLLH